MVKTVKSREELYLEFSDEELAQLGLAAGDKLSWEIKDGKIFLTPYSKLDIDLAEFSRETLEFLISQSCERDVSVNGVIEEALKDMIKYGKPIKS